MKFTIICIALCFFSLTIFAQNPYSVKGKVIDSIANSKLKNTTICILNAKDSTLRAFTRAADDGSFAITGLNKGKFILLASYPDYADYVERFTLDSTKKAIDFQTLKMDLKARLLAEVIIKAKAAAVKIKGDTTEYNAAGFVIQPNDKVEDLLKQLPGIQVDKDGQITAQGQKVGKVLLDGEEFFGDDPTLVTKNIRADMVDKVQVYDKKSDQAAFTGIDDGQKTKTVNIKLKEGKKDGYFGKLDGGVATRGYYEGEALFNYFKPKEKASVFAAGGNDGKTGLNWRDNNKYGFADNSGGGMYYGYGGGGDDLDSFDGQYNGQGNPLARQSGVHYDTKLDSDKATLNTNYKIGSIDVSGASNSLAQDNTPTAITRSVNNQNFENFMFRQKIDATYEVKLDTSSKLKISADASEKNSSAFNHTNAVTRRFNDTLLNDNDRITDYHTNQKAVNATAFYTKKFKKFGRTLSFNASESITNSDSHGKLMSAADFYNTSGVKTSEQNIDQFKINKSHTAVLGTNLTYSEPLSKALAVVVNYGFNVNNANADRRSYDKSASGNYDLLNDTLSSDYNLNQVSNQVGATLNYKKGKSLLNFGANATAVNFKQIDEFTDKTYTRNFLNWNPNLRYQYRASNYKSFSFNYYGSTNQPRLDQIQPLKNNADPLNVTIGNPLLRPSFQNSFSGSFNSYKVLSNQQIWIDANYTLTSNAIVNNTLKDSSGRNTFQSINLTNHSPSTYYFYGEYGRKVTKADIYVGLSLNTNGNTSYNYINGALNTTHSNTYSASLTIQKYVEKKYSARASFSPNYNTSESSLQPKINNNGRGYNMYGYISLYLPGKFQISTDDSYEFRGKTVSFNSNFEKLLIKAELSKAFGKAENLKLSIAGNDLLNQNVGFSRNAYDNFIIQNSYNTIKRYFMFSVSWDFNKMGGGDAKK